MSGKELGRNARKGSPPPPHHHHRNRICVHPRRFVTPMQACVCVRETRAHLNIYRSPRSAKCVSEAEEPQREGRRATG